MTYSTAESSYQGGAPVELYTFACGASRYYYTSADEDQLVDLVTYRAAPIVRGDIEQTSEVAKLSLRLTVARDFPVADLYRVSPPSEVVTLSLSRLHRGDGDKAVVWMGRVLNAEWAGHQATLVCESVYTSIKRTGLRRQYQRSCPHVLYSVPCGVAAASYREDVPVYAVSGTTIECLAFAAKPAGYYSGGFIEYQTPAGLTERRAIRDHTGQAITVTHQIPGLAPGATITAYPGCDHTTATCQVKFANILNYGGAPYIPQKNPFGGSSLY